LSDWTGGGRNRRGPESGGGPGIPPPGTGERAPAGGHYGAAAAQGRGNLSRGAGVEPLGPGPLPGAWLPPSGSALGLLPEPEGGCAGAAVGARAACVELVH